MSPTKQDRRMSEELTRKFIDKYRNSPCLWKTKHPQYNNKQLKKLGYQELLEIVRSEFPNANVDFVVRKINTMRNVVRKEHNKAVTNKHVPILWYYDLLKFIFTQNDDEENAEIINEEEDGVQSTEMKFYEDKMKGNSVETEIAIQGILQEDQIYESNNGMHVIITDHIPHQSQDNSNSKSEPHKTNNAGELREEVLEDEFDAIATCIAAKLRKIDGKNENQRYICEKLINDALFKGLMSNLTENTTISEEVVQYCIK